MEIRITRIELLELETHHDQERMNSIERLLIDYCTSWKVFLGYENRTAVQGAI
jgi:hypothetical protein